MNVAIVVEIHTILMQVPCKGCGDGVADTDGPFVATTKKKKKKKRNTKEEEGEGETFDGD